MISIKHRYSGAVLFEDELGSLRLVVEAAVIAKANLRGADLSGAYLRGAYLRGADLSGADLSGAKIREGITVTKPPIQIYGLPWPITIWDAHMHIGCEFHSHAEWAQFDDASIVNMDGRNALTFWRAHKSVLLALCASHAPESA